MRGAGLPLLVLLACAEAASPPDAGALDAGSIDGADALAGADAAADGATDLGVAGDAEVSDGGGALPDLGLPDAGAAGALTIGTGQDRFEPLTAGQRVAFVVGPQSAGDPAGGFHVFTGVRATGIDPVGVEVAIELQDRMGVRLGAAPTRRLSLVPDGEGGHAAWALAAILDDCCVAVDQPIRLVARVTPRQGPTLSATLEVLGDDGCRAGGKEVCR